LKPEDYLSIGEFARIVGITPNSLRVYDNKGIFSPAIVNVKRKIGHPI
jgi:DNA-binding transcriptional MerR regulator